jgi:hypothetical protein
MIFDSHYLGPEFPTAEDKEYVGSVYSKVKEALFANRYYLTWGAKGEAALPVYGVSLGRALRGVFSRGSRWPFQAAADRAIESPADLRWGPGRRGFRRILHPNGVCLFGRWEIDDTPDGTSYTGQFKKGSRALIIGRYSTCCTETRRNHYRSLALVGKLYPTDDPNHTAPLRTASFISQEDLGGTKSRYINDAILRNAPDTRPWRRGLALPVLLVTGLVFRRTDKQPTIRQLYQIAELGKSAGERTSAPKFMQLRVHQDQPRVDEIDFRDEILAQIYDKGRSQALRKLIFTIEVSDHGTTKGLFVQRRTFDSWKRIGHIIFDEAVASYNGDFVLHFHHPPWRNDRNDPSTLARERLEH